MTTTPEHDQPGSQDQHNVIPPEHRTSDSGSQPTVQLPDVAPTDAAPAQPLYRAHDGSVNGASAHDGSAHAGNAHGVSAPPSVPHGAPQAYPAAPQPEHAAFQQSEPGSTHGQGSVQPKSRSGALLAGLAIGALVGGVVGGGVAAVVASNSGTHSVAQGGSNNTLTLNNPENATAISGVAAVATPSVVTLEVSSSSASGSGSGVIYSEDGYIMTNAHVVTLDGAATEGAAIRVKLSDGRILDGDLVGVDPYADLAVVKVDAESLPAIEVADSSELNVGDLTVAIGAPLNLSNTVTSGVVSALNRGISVGSPLIPQDPSDEQEQPDDDGGGYGFPWDFEFENPDSGETPNQEEQPQEQQQSAGGTVTIPVVQTDASINPGNSGGALLNGSGELIGINVAIASATSGNGTAGSDGLGFAIPANLAVRVADALIAGEQPSHGLLGASVADSSQDTDEDANRAGGLIVDLVKDGAANEAGLKSGDVITAVDGVPAVDGTSVSALIRVHEGGSTITIDYTRNGVEGQADVKLGNLEW